MRRREWRFRIHDILEAIGRIQQYTSGMSYEEFCLDQRTVDAVTRNFEIIGEAAGHVPPEIESLYPQMPWRQSRAMRNELIHAYFGVDVTILWDSIQQDLPPLVPLLLQILEEESQDG